ncbi:hypothetical protein [Nocardia wallacei]|nr:hypothetical protein [Nocardia wallacei]
MSSGEPSGSQQNSYPRSGELSAQQNSYTRAGGAEARQNSYGLSGEPAAPQQNSYSSAGESAGARRADALSPRNESGASRSDSLSSQTESAGARRETLSARTDSAASRPNALPSRAESAAARQDTLAPKTGPIPTRNSDASGRRTPTRTEAAHRDDSEPARRAPEPPLARRSAHRHTSPAEDSPTAIDIHLVMRLLLTSSNLETIAKKAESGDFSLTEFIQAAHRTRTVAVDLVSAWFGGTDQMRQFAEALLAATEPVTESR